MKELRNDTSYQIGNKKLGDNCAYLNLCPGVMCPSLALNLCQLRDPRKTCYSIKAETTYGSTVCPKARMSSAEYWARNSPWQLAQDLIRLNSTRRKTKITVLRINESGDFFTIVDVEKAEMLAAYLSREGIKTYTYTARSDLQFDFCEHLVVNCSGWSVPGLNRFQVAYDLKKNEGTPGWTCKDKHGVDVHVDRLCPGDCRKCDMCQKRGGLTIGVIPH